MKIKKAYLLIVLFLCGLSVGNLFASASAAADAAEAAEWGAVDAAIDAGDDAEVERLIREGFEGSLLRDDRDYFDDREGAGTVEKLMLVPSEGMETDDEEWGELEDAGKEEASAEAPLKDDLGQQLIIAVRRGDKAEVKRLIAAGVDVNAIDDYENTALLWATINKDIDMVRLLLDEGADANPQPRRGYTPLTYAEEDRQTAIVDLLLKAGAKREL